MCKIDRYMFLGGGNMRKSSRHCYHHHHTTTAMERKSFNVIGVT